VIALPNSNKSEVAAQIISVIKNVVRLDRFQIGMPIMEAEFINAIINVRSVMSLVSLKLENVNGTIMDRVYSSIAVNMDSIKNKGFYFAESGDIFEMRFPDYDIEVTVQ